MRDITSVGEDIGLNDTDVTRAGNILSIQVGSLTYAPLLGIDLKYFLDPNYQFQNESFKSYCVQVLAQFGINVSSVTETIQDFYTHLLFKIKNSNSQDGSLIAR